MLTEAEDEMVRGYAKLRYDEYYVNVLKDLHKEFRGLDGVENVLGKPVESKDHASKRTLAK
jgi:hypothetical protein